MGGVDVVLEVVVVHHMLRDAARVGPSWAASWAGRSGPCRAHIPWAAGRPGPSNFYLVGPGPARPIIFFKIVGQVRPGPSQFHNPTHVPARPITFSDRSGLDHRPMASPSPERKAPTTGQIWEHRNTPPPPPPHAPSPPGHDGNAWAKNGRNIVGNPLLPPPARRHNNNAWLTRQPRPERRHPVNADECSGPVCRTHPAN